MKKYIDSLVSFIINRTVWAIIAWIGGIFMLNIPQIFSRSGAVNNQIIALSNVLTILSICISTFMIILLILIYDKKQNPIISDEEDKKQNPIISDEEELIKDENPLLDDISFRNIRAELNITSHDDIQYKQVFNGIIKNDDIREFSRQLSWYGTTYKYTQLEKTNIEMYIKDNIGERTQSPYKFSLYFDEDVSVGDRIKFTTTTFLSDEDRKVIPYSLFCVKYPMDTLTLRLSIPKNMVRKVRRVIYKDHAAEIPTYSSQKGFRREDVGDIAVYIWDVPSPVPWQYYGIEWEFTDEY